MRYGLLSLISLSLLFATQARISLQEEKELALRYAEHNAQFENGEASYRVGMNHLSHLTKSEMRFNYGFSKNSEHLYDKKFASYTDSASGNSVLIGDDETVVTLDTPVDELPVTVDWRQSGYVTPIKNQAQCGSCWAYASTEALEYYVGVQAGRRLTLSTQQMTQCPRNPFHCGGTGGCGGATGSIAFDYVIGSKGMTDSDFMGYEWGTNVSCVIDDPSQEKFTCQEAETGFNLQGNPSTRMYGTLSNYTILPENDYVTMMNAIAKVGPVVVNVDAGSYADPTTGDTTDTFRAYSGGVYTGCSVKYNSNQTDLNHLMVVEGYGTDPEYGDYWLVRNSWRSNWGEGGYIRIQRSADDATNCDWDVTPEDGYGCNATNPLPVLKVCGPCGILSQGIIITNAKYLNAGESSPLYTDPALAPVTSDDDDDDDNNIYFTLSITFIVATVLSVAGNVYFFRELGKARGTASSGGIRNPMI